MKISPYQERTVGIKVYPKNSGKEKEVINKASRLRMVSNFEQQQNNNSNTRS